MKKWKQQIPAGVQDFLPDECYNKRILEERIRRTFFLRGYDEIETPNFEYYDVFTDGKSSIDQEQMLKFSEMGGRILVLRPDNTMPIARIAATKMKKCVLPLRLSYISNIYRYEELQYGKKREVAQAGVELLGVPGPEADAEVIAASIETLLELGLKDFQIDIGQVEFFKGLVEEAGLRDDQAEDIRYFIDHKNMLSLELQLNDLSISPKIKRILLGLPKLYGNGDMLKEAMTLSDNPRCRSAIQNIQQVYEILKDLGLAQYISFDLGMIQSLTYYTGIIFRGITKELGYPICGGGRYDQLVSDFGYDIPATGFAMGIKRILMALERQSQLGRIPKVDYLVSYDDNSRAKGHRIIEALRDQGKRTELFLKVQESMGPMDYAQMKGIKNIVVIENNEEAYYHLGDSSKSENC